MGAGPGIDVYSMRQPIGIGAGITPFNFPAMIPMWMFGPAIATGNAFILKPSERDPSVPVRLAELMLEAGLPEGILQVVHGDKEMVDAILDHPDIGAHQLRRLVRHRALRLYARHCGGKARAGDGRRQESRHRHARRRSRPGRERPAGAAFGSAGERCMALPVVVPVGDNTADRAAREADPRDRGAARRRLDRCRGALRPGRDRRAQGA
jgi:malonate-semialdehyde dehydrogenase (acetylating)/methylmalonate-semialdehyde dehydrogenase